MPRPLPPNPPIPKASPSQARQIDSKPPLHAGNKPHPPGNNVSSARERRRRNKLEGGRGRVVLKSRSAVDLCKKEDKRDGGSPAGRRRAGQEEVDSAPSQRPMVEDKRKNDVLRVEASVDKERDGDGESGKRQTDKPCAVDEPDSGPVEDLVKRSCSEGGYQPPRQSPPSQHKGGGAAVMLNEQSSDEVEVEEFFNLLDTTLHLPESPLSHAPLDSEDHPGPPVKAFSVEEQVRGERDGEKLPPGRLADRIKALKE